MELNIIALLVICVSVCECLDILVIYPHFGKSHYLVFQPLFKKLASKGHNLTVISFFPQQQQIPNFRDIVLSNDQIVDGGIMNMEETKYSRLELYGGPDLIASFAEISCPVLLSSPNVQAFLKERKHFDVILIEFFNTNCAMGIAKKFDAPIIGLSTCVTPPFVNSMFGTPDNPTYIPNLFLDHSDKMTFFERLENTLFGWYSKWTYKNMMAKPGNTVSKKYLGEDILEGGDKMNNASLLLSNTHYSFNRPKPLSPNIIEVAGIHIEEAKKLPEVFENYLDESPNGVIYMSMGTMLQGTSFPRDKRRYFQNVFAKLPQRVIWKWENSTMEGKPNNVLITKWAPQRDILCHPNVRAFISHGGLLGTLEAIHCGVPILVIPQFGDQHINAKTIEASGGGVIMKLSEVTEQIITHKLEQVLSEELRRNAKDLSERFRDRPLSPMDTAVYWIEYVAKFKGAIFMRTVATDMPFHQLYLLDVLGFLALVISVIMYTVYKVVTIMLRKAIKRTTKLKSD